MGNNTIEEEHDSHKCVYRTIWNELIYFNRHEDCDNIALRNFIMKWIGDKAWWHSLWYE